jgi:predicted alpha/beta superfamily hydrolase
VLYLQDGEKVFRHANDPGDAWEIEVVMQRLFREKQISPPIVVAIDATENRAGEYMPEEAVQGDRAEAFVEAHRDRVYRPASRAYLEYLSERLMPWVEEHYDVQQGASASTIGGCSRGALFAIYALCSRPDRFGAAVCMSPHWPHGDGLVIDWLEKNLPKAGRHRFYFDYGDQGLDAAYAPFQDRVDQLMELRGYRFGRDWETRFFPGEGHAERYWGGRLHMPLSFMYLTTRSYG